MSRYIFISLFIFYNTVSVYCQSIEKYRDTTLSTTERVEDLLSRMTLDQKVGQLTCMLGWEMYQKEGDSVIVSQKFKDAVDQRDVGMLWATLRADPWTQKSLSSGLNPTLSAQAINALQKYVIENTPLGIPLLIAEECPHGHMAIGTTVFPTAIGQASTWNPELIEQMAGVIALEASAQGVHIGYGPILDLMREPRWSRMEESYGEDPILIAMMGEAMVKGFQKKDSTTSRGLISSLKHFAGYGNPEGGHNGSHSNIGRRDLLQNYLLPFERAIKAGAGSVMSSYNSIDGIPSSCNEELLTNILREEWGFKGFTISDLGSIEGISGTHRVAGNLAEASQMAIESGLDVDLGGSAYSRTLASLVLCGQLDISVIDRAVSRVLTMKIEAGLFENPYIDPTLADKRVRNKENVELAREVARQSITLLKNDQKLLPLNKYIKKIAVIGPNADNIYNQLGDYTAPQHRSNIMTVLDGLKSKLPGAKIRYVKGCAIRDTSSSEISEAVKAAKESDIAIVVLGGSSARDFRTEYQQTGAATVSDPLTTKNLSDMESGEGYDRATLDLLGNQNRLLKEIASTGTPVILVLIQGRPLNISAIPDNVRAIINAWYPGQEGGNAIADVIFGDYNPAGRLPLSYPRSEGQLPTYYNYPRPYRHNYVEMTSEPLYPFGYGLSYTTFKYSDLIITPAPDGIHISLDIENTGSKDGDEVIQLYLTHERSSVVTPVKQLKYFHRTHLKRGEKKRVTHLLPYSQMTIYNREMDRVFEPGNYIIQIGASSEDIRLSTKIFSPGPTQ